MQRTDRLVALLAGLIAIASPVAAKAQQKPDTPPAAYRPGLGDLMTTTVQPRHIKLGLAGQLGNWPYATYELHELQEAFDRAVAVWPTWRKFSITDMMASVAKEPMAAVEEAIKAGDAGRFTTAYGS